MNESWRQSRPVFWAFFAAPAFWLSAFFLIPLGIIWAYSFGQNAGLTDVAITGTLSNYAHTLEPLYLGIFVKSLWYAALTTLICLILAFPVALAVTFASPKTKIWLLLMIMLPLWTNLLIRTYALMSVLRDEGYINKSLAAIWQTAGRIMLSLGLNPPGDFAPLPLLYNNFAVVFGLVYVSLPFMVLPLYAALDRLDRSLLEASLDLGANHWTTFRRIVIPLAMPGIITGIIITFIPTLGSYLTPALLGGPDSQMIANVIESQFKRANNWPFGAALSFILMYLTFLSFVVRGLFARKEHV